MSTFLFKGNIAAALALFCSAQMPMGAAFAQDNGATPDPHVNQQGQADASRIAPEEILVMRDDFGAVNIDRAAWNVRFNAGARVFVDTPSEALTVVTEPNSAGEGVAVISGTKAFPIGNGKLIFRTKEYVYRDHTLYGNFQPRGLVAGADRRNAIEFVSSLSNFPFGVACRTVANGSVTETVVNIGQDVASYNLYQIVASAYKVDFYINGKKVATHTTNIPTVPLNPYFSTSDGGFGNVPIFVEWVSFSRMAQE